MVFTVIGVLFLITALIVRTRLRIDPYQFPDEHSHWEYKKHIRTILIILEGIATIFCFIGLIVVLHS